MIKTDSSDSGQEQLTCRALGLPEVPDGSRDVEEIPAGDKAELVEEINP
jgi:hypothetical protein